MLEKVLFNLLWIIVAYLIGSINFSIIFTKNNKNKKNIKEVGSGNAGATNAARVYGFKFGLCIFILDASKSFWLGFILGLLQRNVEAFNVVIPQLCLIFVMIGQIFPLYVNFKGGKGASCLLGMIASINLFISAIGTIIFLIIVLWTRYVSLGSIVVPYILALLSFLCPYWNNIDSTIINQIFWYSPLFLLIASLIVTLSHWQNIDRLIHKKESKIQFNNKEPKIKDFYKNKLKVNLINKNKLDKNVEIDIDTHPIIPDLDSNEGNSVIDEAINRKDL